MAATNVYCGIPGVALAANTAKTVINILAPTNQNLKFKGFEIWFNGTTGSDEPVLVELVKCSTAGTATSGTARITDLSAVTAQTTFGYNCTVEPTVTFVSRQLKIHPQGGIVNFTQQDAFIIPGGVYWGLRLTSATVKTGYGGVFIEE